MKFDAADENKNESKFKFQGQSARSKFWFDLDLDWIDINFALVNLISIRNSFKVMTMSKTQIHLKHFKFQSEMQKFAKSFVFHKDAPILSYCQKTLNSCCFSSLSSAFVSKKHFKAANAISILIKESLKSELGNHIDFANEIMLNRKINKGEARVQYKLMKYKNMGDYKILEDISANFTLVQLIDSLENLNHAISVVGSWIFDSTYERALVLNMASLDMICAPSVGEEQDAMFEKVYYSVRYIYIGAQLKKG